MTPKTVGKRLRHAREARKLGVNELDRLTGRGGTGYASRIENEKRSKRPDHAILALNAKALKIRIAWLLLGEGPMEGDDDESPEAAILRATLAGGTSNVDRAATWLGDTVPKQAVEAVRNRLPAITLTHFEVADMIVEEAQKLIAEAAQKSAKMKALRASGSPVESAPILPLKKKRAG